MNKLFRVIANIQLCKFIFKEREKLFYHQSHQLIYICIYIYIYAHMYNIYPKYTQISDF